MLHFIVDRNSAITLTRQIYEQIRDRVLRGELVAGAKLPATRELAMDLHVSRNVVLEAYELLSAEGYLEGQLGSGTYIKNGVRFDHSAPAVAPPVPFFPFADPPGDRIDFRSGVPALEFVPRKKWAALTHPIWLDAPDSLFGYDAPEGRVELREVIAAYLQRTRAILCSPDQILVTSGSVQGLSLIAQALLPSIRKVILEDPSNRDIKRIFTAPGVSGVPVEVDECGIRTALFPKTVGPALVSVTPSHQFPLGGILPISRRIDLIQFARSTESYIIEDDYDSEIRYDGPPVSTVQGLEPGRVIYLGTFSKTLFPSLRLGYMILPRELVDGFRKLKRISDMHSNSLNQLVLAQFIQEGHFERHLSKMKRIYRRRRDRLIQTLAAQYPSRVQITGASTGLHLIADFPGIDFDRELVEEIAQAGVIVHPVEQHAITPGRHRGKLIFGYGHLSEDRIEEGINRLTGVVRRRRM